MSKKGENIYKRKDGRWEGRYVKGRGEDGKLRYGYCYGRSYREVKERLTDAAVAEKLRMPTSSGMRGMRFGDACREWLALCRYRVKESTLVKYTAIAERHLVPRLGACYLHTLTTSRIESFKGRLLTEDALAVKTVRDILGVLRSVLIYASKQSPYAFVMPEIVYPRGSGNEMRVLSREEQARLVNYLLEETDGCKLGVLLALSCGLRIGEVCALRWGDVSLAEGTVRVGATMQRLRSLSGEEARTRIIIDTPKSGASARIIPLGEEVRRLCEMHLGRADAFVLTGEKVRFVEPRVLQYRFAGYAKACGLEGVHFHTLRHTFATRCVEAGFELKSLSEVLGHASPKITLERYVHSSMELKRSNMNKLSFFVLPPSG